jgi:hypothetical protein
MSNAIEQARSRTHKNDHVVVVTWDKDLFQSRREKMEYAEAQRLAAHDRPDSRYEHRIILIPAF